jgi:hypothetical protein
MKRLAFVSLAMIGVAVAGIDVANGHSFYPWECCHDQDCYPIPVEDVKATPQGWFIAKERVTIPYESARPSPDGRFHICRSDLGKGSLITPKDKPPCFWAPEGAS